MIILGFIIFGFTMYIMYTRGRNVLIFYILVFICFICFSIAGLLQGKLWILEGGLQLIEEKILYLNTITGKYELNRKKTSRKLSAFTKKGKGHSFFKKKGKQGKLLFDNNPKIKILHTGCCKDPNKN